MIGLAVAVVLLLAFALWASKSKPIDWEEEDRNYFLERHRKDNHK